MKATTFNILFALVVFVFLFTSTQGLGNKWKATDPRCSVGGSGSSSYRLKRTATTNNQPGYYYRFNMNNGGCQKQFGNPAKDSDLFASVSECERECLNIYHASY